MKRYCFNLTVMLVAISTGGLAQPPQTPASPPASSSQPPASSPLPAAAQQSAPLPAAAQPSATQQSATQQSAAPAVSNSAMSTGGPIDPNRYVIGAEDSLQISVWKDATLSGTVPVRPDGMISLNLVGDLRAAGLTPMALAADITQRLKKYIQDPVVTVVVLGVNRQRIFTVGEVNKVGPLMLTPGMTPLQAIVSAGGLSQFANSKRIYILRTVAGKQQKIPFNYKQALKGDNQGVTLIPGDTIVVP
jgi:polysaccharide export outer membrane protein